MERSLVACYLCQVVLILIFVMASVHGELHGGNVCTFNNGTRHYRNKTIHERVNTQDAQCHARNSYGACIRWEYYKNVSRTVQESYIVNNLVKACCAGSHQIDNRCEVCASGTYGWQCEGSCRCPVNQTCDVIEGGNCYCLPGLTGLNCDEECQDGFYGFNCSSSCDCLYGNDCDKITGKCFPRPHQVNDHSGAHFITTEHASSIAYYVVIAVPACLGLVIIILNAVFIYQCRKRKRLSHEKRTSRVSGTREDYETIDDHFLSNNYVDMPNANDIKGFKVIEPEFSDETYNEIHPEIHQCRGNEDRYTEVTCVVEVVKGHHASLTSCHGDPNISGNYDTMQRSWERNINDECDNESDYNKLEKDSISYDTFQSVKEASSMTSLPAYLDDNYSNFNISNKGESMKSLTVESFPS